MGKKSGTGSWFTAVKRAFSPHKSTKAEEHQDDDDKILQKREKRRWLFKKPAIKVQQQQHEQDLVPVEIATAATAHAAAEMSPLSTGVSLSSVCVRDHLAAILIQTTFRGYLARKALRALKGIVMLQAVIRGQNVRKQAAITLRCMQALLRVQSRVQDQRARLSHDERRKPTMRESENTPFWESKYLQDIPRRKSMVCNRNLSTMDEKELEETASWLDQWIREKQWENQRTSRACFDRRDSIKTIEIDSSRPSSRSGTCVYKLPYHSTHCAPSSPSRRSSYSPSTGLQPITPPPVKTIIPLQIRSASPRCLKEERNASIRLTPRAAGSMSRYSTCGNDMTIPNYMAATESAKARIRSQSTPRQRPATPERERVGSVKKRLAYPVLDQCDSGCDSYCDYGHNVRSPSLKSVQVRRVGMGQQWYYADSATGGEISPCSTTDLRRWLR